MVRNARRAKSALRAYPERALLGFGVLLVFVRDAVLAPAPGEWVLPPPPPPKSTPVRQPADTPRVLIAGGDPAEREEREREERERELEARSRRNESGQSQEARSTEQRAPERRVREPLRPLIAAQQPAAQPPTPQAPAHPPPASSERSKLLQAAAAWAFDLPFFASASSAPAEAHAEPLYAAPADVPAPSEPAPAEELAPPSAAERPLPANGKLRVRFSPLTQAGGPIAPDGRVATFSLESSAAGSVYLTATYDIRVPQGAEGASSRCRLESLLSDGLAFTPCAPGDSCRARGHAESDVGGQAPAPGPNGATLRAWQTASRVLPLKVGVNTYYLLGRSDCKQAVWGTITLRALQID